MSQSPEPEPEVILEPGDPGYVAPEPPADAVPSPAGEDLQHVRQPKESDAEFLSRTRGTVVESQSPSDIVPNTPQIRPFPTGAEPEPEQVSSPQQGETQAEPAA